MHLLVLTNEPDNYSNRRLREAAASRGFEAELLPPRAFLPRTGGGPPALREGYTSISDGLPDVVLPRRGSAITPDELAVVRAFGDAGVRVVNRARAITIAQDKFGTLQVLVRHGLPAPRTVIVRTPEDIDQAWPDLGEPPLVIKPVTGTHGRGVELVHTIEEARNAMRAARSRALQRGRDGPVHHLLQEFLREASGRDVRLFVAGGRFVAAMTRIAAKGDFRANYHRGGRAEAFEPEPALIGTAIAATAAIGLDIAGVDVVLAKRGPLVIEVNSGPGFQALEDATGADVAGAIVDLAAERAAEARA